MVEGLSPEQHIAEFNQVYYTLEIINEGLDDEGKALLLVSSLPKSYENFVNALMYGRQTLTLDEVKVALKLRFLLTLGSYKENKILQRTVLKGRYDNKDEKKKK